jgi:hypothetical protein
MDKIIAVDRVKTAPGGVTPARKRSPPIQKPVPKRGTITQAQADAAVRKYFAQAQAK